MRPWRRPWYYAEVDEPYSWIIGILAVLVAMTGVQAFRLATYTSVYSYIVGGVVIGMVVHELMHRNVARRYGMRSSYVINWLGVIITLVTAILPIKLIAPGYTRVYSHGFEEDRKGILRSVAAGPTSNIVMAIVALVAGVITRALGSSTFISAFASTWLIGFSNVNSYLAFFNLLPIPPLDGYKIFRLSLELWIAMFVVSIAFFIATSIIL